MSNAGDAPRITAGILRGRVVRVPQTGGVRPMLARTRQALFNVLGNGVGGSVWDCFAGSGLLGLEALSRGADHCVMVERDRRHADVIDENLRALGVEDQCTVLRASAFATVRPGAKLAHTPAELVFVDPPHAMTLDPASEFWPWLRALRHTSLLDARTIVVFGHPAAFSVGDTGGLSVRDRREYGTVAFSLLSA